MADPDFSAAQWFKSTQSADQGQCVEFAVLDGWVGVRDSKNGNPGPVLSFTPEALGGLLAEIKETDTEL